MSHFTTINTQVRDIQALRSAVQELGLELLENAVARGFANNQTHGEYVVRLKGPYDVALDRSENGAYGLTTDWWDGHVERELGSNFGRLLQLYGVHKATMEARKHGHFVRRQAQQDGSIKLTIGGVA